MDAGFRTPLLDLFVRGEADRDVRLLAARGALAPRAHEQLALLIRLLGDPDAEVSAAAHATMAAIPQAVLRAFLARTDVPEDLRLFLESRGLEPGSTGPVGDAETPLVEFEANAPSGGAVEAGGTEIVPSAGPEGTNASAASRIAALGVAQRVALAMKGTREERAILIRDPNKLVGVAVLSSPKLTESEVEGIARMATLSEELLRIIAQTRAWMKSYAVCLALARNPKTPVAVSMNLLSRLSERDLRQISTDRNVPDVLRVTAKKKIVLDK